MMRNDLFFTVCVGMLLGTMPACGQTVNYGALEEIFGQPVTTSATGKPQRVSDVPANMEIITQDDIRRSGADNIPDILQFLPGINFRRTSFNDAELSIRGYDQPWNPRLLVLLNGRPVYEDFFGDVIWSMIPVQLDEIRQIEVVKGPNSALFGFNAASGVINIVTFDPTYDTVNAVTTRTGTQGLAEGSVVTTVPVGETAAIRASVGGTRANEFQNIGIPAVNTINGLARPRSDSVNIDAHLRLAPNVMLAVEGGGAESWRNLPAEQTPENDRTNDQRVRLTANTGLGTIEWDNYRTVWNIDYLSLPSRQEAQDVVYDSRLSDLFKIGTDHTVRLSLEYKDNQASGQFLAGSKIKQQIASAGAMWAWQIRPDLSFTNSLRLDHMQLGFQGALLPATGLTVADYNNRELTTTSFNSGLVHYLTSIDMLRLTVSRGYQLPSLNALAQQLYTPPSAGGPFTQIGQPYLRPTAVLNGEIGYDHKFTAIDATLRTALFVQRNSSLFSYDAAAVPVGLQSANIGSSDEVGGEIGLKGTAPGGWRWNLSYSYAQITDHIDSGIAPAPYTAFAGATPKHTVDFGLGYSLDKWEFDAQGRWQSRYQDWRYPNDQGSYYPVETKPYITSTARVGYSPVSFLTLSTTVEQLNQERLYERASIPVERRVIAAVTAHF